MSDIYLQSYSMHFDTPIVFSCESWVLLFLLTKQIFCFLILISTYFLLSDISFNFLTKLPKFDILIFSSFWRHGVLRKSHTCNGNVTYLAHLFPLWMHLYKTAVNCAAVVKPTPPTHLTIFLFDQHLPSTAIWV